MAINVSKVFDKLADRTAPIDQKANPQAIADFKAASKQVDTTNSANNPFVDFVANARNKYNSQMSQISDLSKSTDPASLTKMQFQISNMMITQDLMAKVVGKANQTLETLLKMQ